MAKQYSRRSFIHKLGASGAAVLVAPYLKSENILAYSHQPVPPYAACVAVTQATNYDRTLIKQKVQHLFESIGGIGDLMSAGKKVGIKINLTGGGNDIDHMFTHPEVLRAVGECILDCGVSANAVYIVEALWSTSSYNNNGYLAVQQGLGAQLVDLNNPAPYASFINKAVGDKSSFYTSFTVNKILEDIDVYVSIPKMKQHYEGGVTVSLKNQIGIVPKQLYQTPTNTGRRDALHTKDGTQSSTIHLPKSICDLNFARPVHLAVVDGVKNARGGEGNWNPTFKPWEDHVLLAGKDPVATDSVAAYLMGNDPQLAKLKLPDGGECDNYLELLHQKGMGTNQMNEIEIVGDGKGLITSARSTDVPMMLNDYQLFPNYPNPFNPSTRFSFNLPADAFITITMYSIVGQEIETLVHGDVPRGLHHIHWTPKNISSGIYLCSMRAGEFHDSIKMIFQK